MERVSTWASHTAWAWPGKKIKHKETLKKKTIRMLELENVDGYCFFFSFNIVLVSFNSSTSLWQPTFLITNNGGL